MKTYEVSLSAAEYYPATIKVKLPDNVTPDAIAEKLIALAYKYDLWDYGDGSGSCDEELVEYEVTDEPDPDNEYQLVDGKLVGRWEVTEGCEPSEPTNPVVPTSL